MSKNFIIEELKKTRSLLLEEKEEDLFMFRTKMANTSLSERRKQGVCWYPVKVDRTKFDSGERLILQITRQNDLNQSHAFQSGKLVSIFSNAQSHSEEEHAVHGVVNSIKDQEMIITLNADRIPNWMELDQLGVQLMFDENSYREMERAMNFVIDSEEDRITHLLNVIFGVSAAEVEDPFQAFIPSLNEKQNDAVQHIQSAKDIAIVHGPPGTGKTTTIIQAILQTLKTENQTLVCAPSNAAVDLLVENLMTKGVNVLRIGHPARVTEDILQQTLDARSVNHPDFKDLKMLRRQADEYAEMAGKYKRNFGNEEREQRRQLRQEVKKLRKEAEQLSFYITSDIIEKADVIACTLVGASNRALKGRTFSSVFIDEAAQALEPACWIPISKSHRVIFAGDHCQLPPTIKSIKAAKGGLEKTLFEKSIVRGLSSVMLNEQYRMHEKIMNFSSAYFYNDELFANETVANKLLIPEDLAVEFIDTAGCGFFESQNPETKSLRNEEEANLLIRHLDDYMALIGALNMEHEVEDIGIISPYRSQAGLLRQRILKDKFLPDWVSEKVSVNTVDSFQGQERDIIYISLVRSNDSGQIGFLNDVRRMNVAMTRAKKKLVVLGDSGTICRNPFYDKFVDYVNEIGAYRSGFEWMS